MKLFLLEFCQQNTDFITGMLDCKDGTIMKPVIPNKGERERYFYELVYGDVTSINSSTDATRFFSDYLYNGCDRIRELKSLVPEFLGLTTIPEHPDGMKSLHNSTSRPYRRRCRY